MIKWMKLGELCEIRTGKLNANDMKEDGIYPFYTCNKNPYKTDSYAFDMEAIILSGNGSQVGHINYYKGKFNAYQRTYVIGNFIDCICTKYVLYYMMGFIKNYIQLNAKKTSVPYITLPMLEKFEIPIPSLEEQERIVSILDRLSEVNAKLIQRLQQERDYRKLQCELFISKIFSEIGSEITMKLEDLVYYEQPKKYIVRSSDYNKKYTIPVLTAGKSFILGYTDEKTGIYRANSKIPVILFDDFTASTQFVDFDFKVKSSAIKILSAKDNVNLKYCYYYIKSIRMEIIEHKRLWLSKFSKINIPVPSIYVQSKIVDILDRMNKSTTDILKEINNEIMLQNKRYEYYTKYLLNFNDL